MSTRHYHPRPASSAGRLRATLDPTGSDAVKDRRFLYLVAHRVPEREASEWAEHFGAKDALEMRSLGMTPSDAVRYRGDTEAWADAVVRESESSGKATSGPVEDAAPIRSFDRARGTALHRELLEYCDRMRKLFAALGASEETCNAWISTLAFTPREAVLWYAYYHFTLEYSLRCRHLGLEPRLAFYAFTNLQAYLDDDGTLKPTYPARHPWN